MKKIALLFAILFALNVSATVQTLNLPAIANKYINAGTFTVTATSTAGFLATITYTSSNPSIATVDLNSGLVTIVGTLSGNVTITANSGAVGSFDAATPVSRTFTVMKNVNTVTFPFIANQIATTTTLSPTAATCLGGTAITYTSSDTSVASVNATTGVISITTSGTVTITATAASSTTYEAGSKSRTFSITKAINTITFATITNKLLSLGSFTPTAATCIGSTPITYASSNTSVATVNASTGLVTLVAAGNVSITASTVGSARYASATSSKSFSVLKTPNTMTFAVIPNQLIVTGTYTPTAATNTGGTPITYSSNQTSVATVNSTTGVITLVAPGTVTITASTVGSATIDACSASRTFTVSKSPNTMTFATIANQLMTTGTFTPTAATNSGGTAITYSSSNTNVATIDSATRLITLVAPGSVTITASTIGSDSINACSASRTFSVSKAPNTITFAAITDKALSLGSFTPTAATCLGSTTITYSSNDTSVATVNASTGVVTLIAAGTVTITASTSGSANYAAASLGRTFSVTKSGNSMTFAPIANQLMTTGTFTPTLASNTGGTAITYASSNTNVATINATTGLITLVAPGSVTITASTVGNSTINACSASRSFSVSKASNTMTYNTIAPQFVTVGTFTPTAASCTGGTPITYSSSNTAVATVNSSTGAITVISAGTTYITANTIGSATIASCFKKQLLKVNLLSNTLTFPTISSQLMTTGTLAVTATPITGTVVYTSLAPAVATVNSSTGLITFVQSGTAIIKASVAATGNYAASTITRSFTISKANQTITWTAIPSQSVASFLVTPITLSATASSALTVTYSVISGPAFITGGNILNSTGVSGPIRVRATQAGNGSYNSKTQDLTISITATLMPLLSEMKTSKENTGNHSVISVYPNPANDIVYVNHTSSIQSISVFDITGRKMMTVANEYNSTSTKIDLSDFKKGIYILKLIADDKEFVERVILQ